MKEQILEMIRTRGGGVSFVELSEIEGFEGGLAWGSAGDNIWFWHALSDEAIDALIELTESKQIEMTPTSALVYFVDGRLPSWPVAKQARKYKQEHWLPVSFNLPKPKRGRRPKQ